VSGAAASSTDVFFWKCRSVLETDSATLTKVMNEEIEDLERSTNDAKGKPIAGAIVFTITTDNAANITKASSQVVSAAAPAAAVALPASESEEPWGEDIVDVDEEEGEEEYVEDEASNVGSDDEWLSLGQDEPFPVVPDFAAAKDVIHIPCHSHVINLEMTDAFKHRVVKAAVACGHRVADFMRKKTRKHFIHACAVTGAKRKIVLPTEVRWNSMIRCLVSVLALFTEVNLAFTAAKMEGISEYEKYTITIAVIVLSPLCWASDRVQGDQCTVMDVVRVHRNTKVDLECLRLVAERLNPEPKTDLLSTIDHVFASLAAREKLISNKVVEVIDFFDPSTPTPESAIENIVSFMEHFYIKLFRGVSEQPRDALRAEVVEWALHKCRMQISAD
jgi:hypothetical protein